MDHRFPSVPLLFSRPPVSTSGKRPTCPVGRSWRSRMEWIKARCSGLWNSLSWGLPTIMYPLTSLGNFLFVLFFFLLHMLSLFLSVFSPLFFSFNLYLSHYIYLSIYLLLTLRLDTVSEPLKGSLENFPLSSQSIRFLSWENGKREKK